MKKLDIKGIFVDIMRNLISAFLITFVFCTCNQNGWLPSYFMGVEGRVEYNEFWSVAKSISFFIPLVMFVKGLCGCYTYQVIATYFLKPKGKAILKDYIE